VQLGENPLIHPVLYDPFSQPSEVRPTQRLEYHLAVQFVFPEEGEGIFIIPVVGYYELQLVLFPE